MAAEGPVGFYMDGSAMANDHDTTRLLVEEARRRGLATVLFSDHDVASGCALPFDGGAAFPLEDFSCLVLRKDPPVDSDFMEYLAHNPALPFMMNHPSMILKDDKRYMLKFPEFQPRTYFLSSPDEAYHAIADMGDAVIKPVDGYGGKGIGVIRRNDDVESVHSKISGAFALDDEVVVQQYLPEARQGDKRVFVLWGEPIGATLRVPTGELCNIHAGGYHAPASVTPYEREVIAAMRDRLLDDGGYLLGLDFIGGYVTECNATSPGALWAASKWSGEPLERRVIGALLEKGVARNYDGPVVGRMTYG